MKFIKFITCFVLRHLVIAILYYIGLHTALSSLYVLFDLADHTILFTEDLDMEDSRLAFGASTKKRLFGYLSV